MTRRPNRPALAAAGKTKGAPRASKGRKNAKNVRDAVLALLRNGPATRAQLLAGGSFSPAALNLHLRALRQSRKIKAQGKRPILFSLARGAAAEPQIVDVEFEAASPGANDHQGALLPALVSSADLQSALDAVDRRLGAKDRIHEKLLTLERLAGTLPQPIADILNEIRADYVRHAV